MAHSTYERVLVGTPLTVALVAVGLWGASFATPATVRASTACVAAPSGTFNQDPVASALIPNPNSTATTTTTTTVRPTSTATVTATQTQTTTVTETTTSTVTDVTTVTVTTTVAPLSPAFVADSALAADCSNAGVAPTTTTSTVTSTVTQPTTTTTTDTSTTTQTSTVTTTVTTAVTNTETTTVTQTLSPAVARAAAAGCPASGGAVSLSAALPSGASVTVSVPAGGLPAGTRIDLLSANPSVAASLLPSGQQLVDGLAVSWRAPDDTSPQACSSITVGASSTGFAASETLYETTASGVVPLSSTDDPGSMGAQSLTLGFVHDPGFLVASAASSSSTTVGAPNTGGGGTPGLVGEHRRTTLAVALAALLLFGLAAAGSRLRHRRRARRPV